MRILVVEDETKVARALRDGLAAEGYEVSIANTGEDGFFLINSENLDLVILDLLLFQTYPGMYVPRALEICAEDTDRSLRDLTAEVLSLTKMNWNNTEFDNSMPITIQAARRVGRILKYLGKDDKANSLYSYYM